MTVVTLLANPLTTSQDLVVAGTAGAPARLGVGANGQVLTVSGGVVGWANAASGFANPMTTLGDIITGGTGGASQRLPIGSTNQVLTVVSGAPAWAAAASGFANPMTTTGDLIKAGAAGVAQRLAVGSANQYLGVSGGAPAWAQPSVSQVTGAAPLASPAFTGAPSAPTPASGDDSTALATTAFVNASKSSAVIFPSGDTTGVADDAAFYAAMDAIYRRGTTGEIVLVPSGDFYTAAGFALPGIKPVGTITATTTSGSTSVTLIAAGTTSIPAAGTVVTVFGPGIPAGAKLTLGTPNTTGTLSKAAVAGSGAGTKIYVASSTTSAGDPLCLRGAGWARLYGVGGAVTCVWLHRTAGYGSPQVSPFQRPNGYVKNLEIDGINLTGVSIGLDIGDGFQCECDVFIKNFAVTGSYGLAVMNRYFWCEKSTFKATTTNCDTHCYVGQTSNGSHEYNEFDLCLFTMPNQDGLTVDGANLGGGRISLRGNTAKTSATVLPPTNNCASIKIINSGVIQRAELNISTEYNSVDYVAGGGTILPYSAYSDGTGILKRCQGIWTNAASMSGIKFNGAECSYCGMLGNEQYTGTLADLYPSVALPASGTAWTNLGPDAYVRISGGTVSNISLNGTTVATATGQQFFVRARNSLTTTYSVAPTMTVIPLITQ